MPLNTRESYLRWVGGKRRLVHQLRLFVPRDLTARVYIEPFLGAGSLFMALKPSAAHLSDLNEDLINSFRCVKNRPRLVARYLARHAAMDCHSYYYQVRAAYNEATSYSCAQAARFIYLNRTCFNGIFRVNKAGGFNVPYGRIPTPVFPDYSHLKYVSDVLQGATLRCASFQIALSKAPAGAFVYLDPPYPPLNGTSFFRHYTADRFPLDVQAELADTVSQLDRNGCLVMMTNADIPLVRNLYAGFNMRSLSVTRFVTHKAVKHSVSELVITNYDDAN